MSGKEAIGRINMQIVEAIHLLEKHREEITEVIGAHRYETRRDKMMDALILMPPKDETPG